MTLLRGYTLGLFFSPFPPALEGILTKSCPLPQNVRPIPPALTVIIFALTVIIYVPASDILVVVCGLVGFPKI